MFIFQDFVLKFGKVFLVSFKKSPLLKPQVYFAYLHNQLGFLFLFLYNYT